MKTPDIILPDRTILAGEDRTWALLDQDPDPLAYIHKVYWTSKPGAEFNQIFRDAQARENYAAQQEGRRPIDVTAAIRRHPDWPL